MIVTSSLRIGRELLFSTAALWHSALSAVQLKKLLMKHFFAILVFFIVF